MQQFSGGQLTDLKNTTEMAQAGNMGFAAMLADE